MFKNKQKGFTLIELLVVIAILGILSVISFVTLDTVRAKARDTKRISEINQVTKALEVYFTEHGHYPYFTNTAYANESGWDNYELADNWGDLLDILYAEGYLTMEKKIFSAGIGDVNISLQDPSFEWGSDQLYQYMPSADPIIGQPGSFRIRTKLENLSDPVLNTSLTGKFLYTDDAPPHPAACSPSLGYYCVGPKHDFTAFAPGKPVVYLYPEKETQVSVNVSTKKIVESIPEYNNGWQVTAYPDGTIINSDGQEYPYLFWEGISDEPHVDRNKGAVIKSNEVEKFLEEALSQQGLLAKEYDEFIEYWAPRMKAKEYVYVYFMPQEDYDNFIPMEVTPSPDTIIRTYMLFKSLDQKIEVEPQKFESPERTGFTVVEWGGDRKELE